MKTHLMSFIVYLSLFFWSSYGSADYLHDQVIKYCKIFMSRYLGEDIPKKINYRLNETQILISTHPGHWNKEYKCFVNGDEYEYIIDILGWVTEKNHPGGKAEAQAERLHSQDKTIPIGSIEYIETALFFGETHNIMFAAISKVEKRKNLEVLKIK